MSAGQQHRQESMPSELNANQRLDLLNTLQEEEVHSRRRAARAAWISVGLATAVLAILVFGAWSSLRAMKSELDQITEQRNVARSELATIEKTTAGAAEKLKKVQTELAEKQAQLAVVTQALGNVPQAERQLAVEKQLNADPAAAQLLPRVYLQIVDPLDREWATAISRRLQAAGLVVPGIEYVPRAAALKRSDVRYYKKAEEPGAQKIVELLKSAGVDPALIYLKDQEFSTKVRPNHYEVWFAAGSRNTLPR
jgi:uncharacterized protein YoxC